MLPVFGHPSGLSAAGGRAGAAPPLPVSAQGGLQAHSTEGAQGLQGCSACHCWGGPK